MDDRALVSEISGERRHLTVLFCDLVNSTGLSAQLDSEEWCEIVAGYHRVAARAIECFGGHVAQYLGDGMMAYFGCPEAHDNDAPRAGLAILDTIAELNQQLGHAKLSARVGIDSGAVVVGASAGKPPMFSATLQILPRARRRWLLQARWLSLRMHTVCSLATERRRDEAHAMLAQIYGSFTEGSDTRDLKHAKALLDDLAT